MFNRKNREYANEVVLLMHNICPTGDRALTQSFASEFINHFEVYRKQGQPAQAPAVGVPMAICERIYEHTSDGRYAELEGLDQWKGWLATIVDVLLYDEPYASSINKMFGEDYKVRFEKLKALHAFKEVGQEGVNDTYADLIATGRLRMRVINEGLAKM